MACQGLLGNSGIFGDSGKLIKLTCNTVSSARKSQTATSPMALFLVLEHSREPKTQLPLYNYVGGLNVLEPYCPNNI